MIWLTAIPPAISSAQAATSHKKPWSQCRNPASIVICFFYGHLLLLSLTPIPFNRVTKYRLAGIAGQGINKHGILCYRYPRLGNVRIEGSWLNGCVKLTIFPLYHAPAKKIAHNFIILRLVLAIEIEVDRLLVPVCAHQQVEK